MTNAHGRDNIADGLVATSFSLSPKKSLRKTRSKSIGPGGVGELDAPALKESNGNRRKSAFIPAVKSILSSNDEDEKKRREARRKSLARRRVSFAPEATLHTWDVVEYLRDATSSSASSDATRRASGVSQAPAPDSDPAEPPSTPPEQVEEPTPEPEPTSASQRDLHQKKNRRSSGIPPMNFNNPDDVYSSSPLSGDSRSPGDADTGSSESEEDELEDQGTSPEHEDSSQSSAKLDAALRQASAQAGTQKLELDEDGDLSMDMAEDEVTTSFQPWARKSTVPQHDTENADPFSPSANMEENEDDMSMDITRAVGGILSKPEPQSSDIDDDMTMDLTMPLGSIRALGSKAPTEKKNLKRRASMLDASQGSPEKRATNRRTSLRQRRKSEENASEDATMDLTMAIGVIKSKDSPPHQQNSTSRQSLDAPLEDETMDFTLAVGSIKNLPAHVDESDEEEEEDEDLSMEFTKIVGPGIKHLDIPAAATPEKPALIVDPAPEPLKSPTSQSPPKEPAEHGSYFTEAPPGDSIPELPAQNTPTTSTDVIYPTLDPGTPEIVKQYRLEDIEPSPFVARTPRSAEKADGTTTTPSNQDQPAPVSIPDDPIAAPILNRRRSSLSSVQFSPLNAPHEAAVLKSTALLTNHIKLLSTPRKQTLMSPLKRGAASKDSQTPQKQPTPKQKTPTPKRASRRQSASPKKRVVFGEQKQEPVEESINEDTVEEVSDVERISLQDFLDMTKIRFMDLSTTKRRHTAAPAAFHDMEVEEKEDSLDRYVVAGACTLPEYELYQHACHEMKKYISDGRHFVRTMEANVLDENPLLFSEYLGAPPDQRAVMDNQFKNLKTNARLEARGEWYTWRSTLLHDLKAGLLGTMDGFKRDESTLANQEQLLDTVLPALVEKQEQLSAERVALQQRHDELNSCDREELEQARERLTAADAELKDKRHLLAQLQQELDDKEAGIESVKERKTECVEQTKAAERMREDCRGWSTSEVNALKAKVTALEQAHGWSITSASSTSITMTHANDLELYFQPSAFATGDSTANGSISLAYIGDSATPHPRPLTTSKRFFLQLIRAHLHCIPQSQTRIAQLLTLVKNSWATALAVADGIRWLEHSYITEEFILSDERMAIAASMLLPSLQTKIKVVFEIGVSLTGLEVSTETGVKAEVVYGEKYGEEKMSAFLRDGCPSEVGPGADMTGWANGMADLAVRLRKTGRKGERK
ncbi:Spc7-domain-containing protein [Dothidotthia symphoricarpi CBS 119687]|uniref:Spc7-domain-containing protein n=1 Tax=Dothidotthia symphoricarpi CBS 119687 TaxID=1392245 RepID=A0A6A6AN59_9PLEO|nr:Spc7-domain-containing protein [Dothidotthia symphoricarpi CBS 119687]KAF2131921.1 Spc7-domain-containing protein [Dothidotthia symphoricarpi CBS 119687]